MARQSMLATAQWQPPTPLQEFRGTMLPPHLGDPAAEYKAVREHAALFDMSHRGLIRLTGKDRAAWLHNLVTNSVKTLEAGRGVYAFACDVQGRVLFDLNILALEDQLLLDMDCSVIESALKHFDRLLITEDVKLADVSNEFARIGCCGPEASRLAKELGFPKFVTHGDLAHARADNGARIVKSSFAGPQIDSFELIIPAASALEFWAGICKTGARHAGTRVLEVLRIEAGMPASGPDLDKALPAETGQLSRAVNFHKGCYLGQEVIERMRSRGALARRLVRLQVEDGNAVALPSSLNQTEREVGRITSLIPHPDTGAWIGLGYLRSSVSETTGITTGTPPRSVQILD